MNIGSNLSAIKSFENGLNKNANNIANVNTKKVNLVDEMIGMQKNETGIKLNSKVIQAKDDNVGTLLDIIK